jgi:hypothetical protein
LPLYFNPLVIETFARLHGVLAFWETMNDGIPTVEAKEHHYLEQLASAEGWEAGEYFVEKDVLNDKFHIWIPTFAAYSVIILLHSIAETQLDAFAEHMGKRRGSNLRVKDMSGKGVDRSANYLERVLSIAVKTDPAWINLHDLQSLRNIVVHRGGKPGDSREHQKCADRLVKKYSPKAELRKADGFHEQIWISMHLCQEFVRRIL